MQHKSAVTMALSGALLLLLAPCLALGLTQDNLSLPVFGEELEEGAGRLDDVFEHVLDTILRQVAVGMANPTVLREHVKEAMAQTALADRDFALRTGAADCDLSLAQWAAGLTHLQMWALKSKSQVQVALPTLFCIGSALRSKHPENGMVGTTIIWSKSTI